MNARGSVLGIDVGWSKKRKSSAVCRFSWNRQEINWEIQRFRALDSERERTIKRIVSNQKLLAVAIDGPLCPEFLEVNRYRGAERLLSRGELRKRIGKPGQSSSPNGKKLNAQANKSAIALKKYCRIRKATHKVGIDECMIVEAFPTTFLGVLLKRPTSLQHSRNKQRSDIYFSHLSKHQYLDEFVEKILGDRKWSHNIGEIKNHDDRAAFVCALTALCVASGNFTAVGDDRDGWIILPPQWAFANWAWKAICETAHLTEARDEEGKLLSFSKNCLCSMANC